MIDEKTGGKKESARAGQTRKGQANLPNLAHKLKCTVRHVIPELPRWLGKLPDPRDPTRIVYKTGTIVWSVLLLLLCQLRSRRHFRVASDSAAFLRNLNILAGEENTAVPHPDTLANLLVRIPPEELGALLPKIAHTMQRKRMLDRYRLKGHYLVAIDGTGIFSFRTRHCEYCLTKKSGTDTLYYHMVEEAKLVSPGGLAFSVGTESIENPTAGVSVQDCELKAFYRLAPRLKDAFPRTKLCLLLDGLYAAQQVFDLCQDYGWKYLITFQPGSMPRAFDEFETMRRLLPTNRLDIVHNGKKQILRWVNGIRYGAYCLNVLECTEISEDGIEHRFVWLTNFVLDKTNVRQIANRGGRCRWVIENQGFNVQKNCEFHLEHVFTHHEKGWLCYYHLLQVAHLLFQLLYWWRRLKEARRYLVSIYAFIQRLLEHLRTWSMEARAPPSSFQLRLDSS
jgi:hypothetical protein